MPAIAPAASPLLLEAGAVCTGLLVGPFVVLPKAVPDRVGPEELWVPVSDDAEEPRLKDVAEVVSTVEALPVAYQDPRYSTFWVDRGDIWQL